MREVGNVLTVGGVSSDTYDIKITGAGAYKAPAPTVTKKSVPGRNGDLILRRKRPKYPNIKVTYPTLAMHDIDTNLTAWRDYLTSLSGYTRIEDTFNPDEYRMGFLADDIDPEMATNLTLGIFDTVFECMPQRFLKSGETAVTFTEDGTITNPTNQIALPLLKIYGYGDLTVGSDVITIEDTGLEYIFIDCDTMKCYNGQVGVGSYVTLSSNDFPVLTPGSNVIGIDGSITRVDVTPRWWRL
jgi:phage-related protein